MDRAYQRKFRSQIIQRFFRSHDETVLLGDKAQKYCQLEIGQILDLIEKCLSGVHLCGFAERSLGVPESS
jgi:hypothetical protein